MAQAIAEAVEWDTVPASTEHQTISPSMSVMTLLAVPETPSEEEPGATVHFLPHPLDPTPEEVAAKKARRRLASMNQNRDRHGVIRAHYFNADGFDVWGYDERGNYIAAQDTRPGTTTPFPHH